jgi:hypothetical protein
MTDTTLVVIKNKRGFYDVLVTDTPADAEVQVAKFRTFDDTARVEAVALTAVVTW